MPIKLQNNEDISYVSTLRLRQIGKFLDGEKLVFKETNCLRYSYGIAIYVVIGACFLAFITPLKSSSLKTYAPPYRGWNTGQKEMLKLCLFYKRKIVRLSEHNSWDFFAAHFHRPLFVLAEKYTKKETQNTNVNLLCYALYNGARNVIGADSLILFSKRKFEENVNDPFKVEPKEDKRKATRRRKLDACSSLALYKSCQQEGHSTSRSHECPNNIPSKSEDFVNNLGFPYKAFTRKLPLDTAVNNEYKELLINKIIITSNDPRNIISRAMMLINSYCLAPSRDSIPNSIYKQKFWYPVCQLVKDRKVTKSANVPPDLVKSWDTYRASIKNTVYDQTS
ncbi:hypothetical protein F4703DRAFT_1957291 [Phycomyces blakesleeanus]